MADTRALDITIRVRDEATAQLARLEQSLAAFGRSVASTSQRAQAAVATVGPGARQMAGGMGPPPLERGPGQAPAMQTAVQAARQAAQAQTQVAQQAAQAQTQAARQAAQEQLQAARLATQGQMQQARLAAQAVSQSARQAAQSQTQAARQGGQEQLQAARLTAQGQMQQARLAAQSQAQAARQAAQAQAQAARQAGQQQLQAARLAAQGQAQASRQAAQSQTQAARQAAQAQAQAARQAGQAAREHERAARQGSGAFTQMRNSILAMAATVVSIRALTSALQNAVQVAMQFERMSAVLNMVNKDSGGAARSFAFVRAEAERLGSDVLTLAQGYVRLSAATQGTTFAGQGTEEMLQGLNAAFRAYRLTSVEARDATRPLIQMFQSGTVQLDELRNELGTRVPTALKDMALAFNGAVKSETEMFKAMEQGRVTVDAARNAVFNLTQIWRERYTPAAQEAAQATDAAFNRLNNAWLELQKTIGEALLPALGEVARAFTQMLEEANKAAAGMGANGALGESVRQLGSLLIGLIGLMDMAGKTVAAIGLSLVGDVPALMIAVDDIIARGERMVALQQQLLSGGFAALPPVPGATPAITLRKVALTPGKKEGKSDAEKEAESLAQAQDAFQKALADRWAQATLDATGYFHYQLTQLKFTQDRVIELMGYFERIQADETQRQVEARYDELAQANEALMTALVQRIPLQEAEAKLAVDRLAKTTEQKALLNTELLVNQDLTREYERQRQVIEDLRTIDQDLADGLAVLNYARKEGLTLEQAQQELAIRRLQLSDEETQAHLEKVRLLRGQTEEYERHNALIQEQRQILAEVGERVRPRPRSERERLAQQREEVTPENLPEFDRLAKIRIEAVALNDVLEGMRDTASSLGDALEKGLVDVLENAATAGKNLGETMQAFGKGLIKLFGEEIIKLGLMPLRQSLDELAKHLAESEMIKNIVNWGMKLLGLGVSAAAPTGPGTTVSPFVGFETTHGGIFGHPQATQSGGLFASPRVRLLGEATPEAVVPLTAEGIARFTRGLQRGAGSQAGRGSGDTGWGSSAGLQALNRQWREAIDQLAKRPIVLEVTIAAPVDMSKMRTTPEEILHVVGKDIASDGITRRIIQQHTKR